MSGYNVFIERLEVSLESEDGSEDFLTYLQELTPLERDELLAEAARREQELIHT